jgi:hypothetical protein
MCNGNKEDLVSYLYGDLEGAAKLAFERHLRDCAECRDELAAMRRVRADLLTWSPPEPAFAFRIVSEPRPDQRGERRVLRPQVASWTAWLRPAAGLAAAAVLVLAAAAALAHIEVHDGPDGFTVRTGWRASEATTPARSLYARDVNLAAPPETAGLVSIERRIAALEASSRNPSFSRVSDGEVLKVVRELVAQSETRQKGELAFRIAQVMRDVDMKRTADLNGVQRRIGTIDANVTEEAVAHRELMNYILASSKQK